MEHPLWCEIRGKLKEAGDLSFARLMELALYSSHGYYESRAHIGRAGGDFYTASQSPLFALTLAAAVDRQILAWGSPSVVQVVEVGAGQGELAQGMATHFLTSGQKTAIHYCIAEASSHLRQRQRERLSPLSEMKGVEFSWDRPARDLPTVIIANEVLDALPVERIRRVHGSWERLAARLRADGLEWFWTEAPANVQRLADRYVDCPEGMLAEISEACAALMESTLAGFSGPVLALWFDYGMTREEWQTGIRPGGTLRAYRNHEIVDPLQQEYLLEADITADANWTQAMELARQQGMTSIELVSQGKFLMDEGIIELVISQQQGEPDVLKASQWAQQFRQLALPEGMGDRFSVLVCRKGEGAGGTVFR